MQNLLLLNPATAGTLLMNEPPLATFRLTPSTQFGQRALNTKTSQQQQQQQQEQEQQIRCPLAMCWSSLAPPVFPIYTLNSRCDIYL